MRQKFQALLAYKSHGLPPPADPLGMARVAFLTMQGCEVVSADLAASQMRVGFELRGEVDEPVPDADLRNAVEMCLEQHVALSVLSVRRQLGTNAKAEVERILGTK